MAERDEQQYEIRVCSECDEQVERELTGDNRWACPTHGNRITIRFIKVIPEQDNVKTHDYRVVNASTGPTIEGVANQWAKHGWRVVGVVSDTRPGYAHALVLERPVGVSHPDD